MGFMKFKAKRKDLALTSGMCTGIKQKKNAYIVKPCQTVITVIL